MSRARELAKVGGLQQTISGVSTHVGISTFASDVFILGKLDITGDLGFDEMTAVNSRITGISTAQDLIVGRNLSVAGLSTFSGLLKVDGAAIEATSAKFGDLTNNRIVIAGTGGELEDDANLTFDSAVLTVTGSTNTTVRSTTLDLDVTRNVEIAGITTLTGNIDANGALDVDGQTDLDVLNVSDVSTFTGAITANGGVVGALTGNSAGTHTGAVDLNGGVLTLDADADTTITSDTDDQIDIAFGGNDRITLSTGLIDLKNDGSQSAVRLYCESSNAHYAAIQAPAHSDFSGNVTVTLPATTDTLVGRTTTDTLTNKTLTSPTITGTGAIAGTFTGNLTGNASGSSGSCTGNSATATEATNITVSANNSTDETVYPVFVDGATGTQGAETDTGLSYNPSSGVLTAATFSGALSGTLTGNVTGNVTGNQSGGTVSATSAAVADLTAQRVVIAGTSGELEDSSNLTFNGSLLNIVGDVTASGTITGDLTGDVTGNVVGNVTGAASKITVADESSDTTCFPVFVTAATGNRSPSTGSNLTFNSNDGTLSATNLTLTGNLTVQGSTTTVESTTLTVADKNVVVAQGSANDAAADGGGITVDSGDGDKTWQWVDATDSWTSSEHIDLASGKVLKHNTATILSETTLGSSVVNSSLTSVGTIATGTWQGTAINDTYIGTINNADKVALSALDIDGGTDINAAIADADLFICDDGGGGTNRKVAASRLKTYLGIGAGASDIDNLDIDGGTDIGANLADADLFIVDDGAGGTNRKLAASRIKTYVADVTLTTAAQTAITSVGTLASLDISGALDVDGATTLDGLTVAEASTFTGEITANGGVAGNVTGNVTGSSGSCTGNSATASALQNAVDIGGVSFDGSTSINLPGVNQAGNQNTSGNAASATQVYITETATAQNYPIVFTDSLIAANSGNMGLQKDEGSLFFNPSANTLTVSTIACANITSTNGFGTSSQNAYGARTVSTGNPTGGSDGDIWYKY